MSESEPVRRFPQAPPFIGRSLREAFHLLTAEIDAGIGPRHPSSTPSTNRVMIFIDPEGTSMAELARRCQMTRQSVLEHCRRLETHGYVTRRPHPADRRIQLVTLTESGQQAIRDGFEVVQDIHRRWSGAIGADNMATLIDLLDRLVAEVRAGRAAGSHRPDPPP